MNIRPKVLKCAVQDAGSHASHEVGEPVDVVEGRQCRAEDLSNLEEVVDICSAEIGAGVARTA